MLVLGSFWDPTAGLGTGPEEKGGGERGEKREEGKEEGKKKERRCEREVGRK